MTELQELVETFTEYDKKLNKLDGAKRRIDIPYKEYFLHYIIGSSRFKIVYYYNDSLEYILTVSINTNKITEFLINKSTILLSLTLENCNMLDLDETKIGLPALIESDKCLNRYKLLAVLDNEDTIFQMDSLYNLSNYITKLDVIPNAQIAYKTYLENKDMLKFYTVKFKELTNGLGNETYIS